MNVSDKRFNLNFLIFQKNTYRNVVKSFRNEAHGFIFASAHQHNLLDNVILHHLSLFKK